MSKHSEAVYNRRGVRNIALHWWAASLHCYHNEREWCVHARKVILGGKYRHKYLSMMRAKHQKGLMLGSLCSHRGHYLFALVSKRAWWVMNTACRSQRWIQTSGGCLPLRPGCTEISSGNVYTHCVWYRHASLATDHCIQACMREGGGSMQGPRLNSKCSISINVGKVVHIQSQVVHSPKIISG